MSEKILVVDDEEIERVSLKAELEAQGYQVATCPDGMAAMAELARQPDEYALVLCDIKMPRMDGFGLLDEVKQKYPEVVVILMTAYGTIADAVKAMRLGAHNYVTKPFSTDELTVKLQQSLKYRSALKENRLLRQTLQGQFQFHNLVGKSAPMRQIFDKIATIAPTDSTVLIQGETGTGKELAAAAIHYNSHRRDQPFIKLSCAMLHKELLESELFGHEAGSFTGAIKRKRGRFELAHRGTLLLDEVDDIPYELQVKLLRVIEEKQFERVGGEEVIESDVRIIAATKRDLRELVGQGKFRDDLFYRLSVLTLNLPPLRNRKEDIPLLAKHFIDKYVAAPAHESKFKTPPALTDEALAYLMNHDWPGNVRELENVIEQTLTVSKTERLDVTALPEYLILPKLLEVQKDGPVNLNNMVDKVERELIDWALQKAGGNQSRAAELLGIPRTTLREKMDRYKPPITNT